LDKIRKRFILANEIDGYKGIKSPHARELEEFGREKVDILLNNSAEKISMLVKNRLKGKIENIGIGEDYTITLTFFPEVNVHMAFFNYEDEEDIEIFGDAEIRFLFSGERASWVPTEDLNGYIEAVFWYMESILSEKREIYEISDEKSKLLKDAIEQRKAPFSVLTNDKLKDLADFIGGTVEIEENKWIFTKSFFQGVIYKLIYDPELKNLDIKIGGKNAIYLNNYARDQLAIHMMNHSLRFLSITYPDVKFPKIVGQTFSYSYLKRYIENTK